jgi:hypothetical protein
VLLPPDGAVVFEGQVGLKWYPALGATSYRVQLGAEASFQQPLVDRTLAEPWVVTGALPAGRYFWRVGAAAGGEVVFSPVQQLEVRRPAGRAAATRHGKPIAPAQESEVLLPVPLLVQHKDTSMLLLESPNAEGEHAWDIGHAELDPTDPADNMNCALASIAMLASFYSGELSQDRIGFELRKGDQAGPERDLNYGRGLELAEVSQMLGWALSTQVVGERAVGAGGDWGELSPDAMWTTLTKEIDAERPLIVRIQHATGGGHAMAGIGYWTESEVKRWVIVNDPWDIAGQSRFFLPIEGLSHLWRTTGAVSARSDEATIGQDSDGDGIVDFDETERFGTEAAAADSDNDGVRDKEDVYASVHDLWFGYAQLGNARNNVDGDGLQPELDADSDNGGCRDGTEDFSLDGRWDEAAGETTPFLILDDACVTGWHTVYVDQTSPGDAGISHVTNSLSVTFQALLSVPGAVDGHAQAEHWAEGSLTDGIGCPTIVQPRVTTTWTADLDLTYVGDIHLVGITATPDRGPPWFLTTIGCGETSTEEMDPAYWGGTGGTFVDGVYHRREDYALPPGSTGEFYEIIHMERISQEESPDAFQGSSP